MFIAKPGIGKETRYGCVFTYVTIISRTPSLTFWLNPPPELAPMCSSYHLFVSSYSYLGMAGLHHPLKELSGVPCWIWDYKPVHGVFKELRQTSQSNQHQKVQLYK